MRLDAHLCTYLHAMLNLDFLLQLHAHIRALPAMTYLLLMIGSDRIRNGTRDEVLLRA